MKLTIIRGVPGSGKSTFARTNYQCCILENDQMQIVDGKYCWSAEGTRHAIDLVHDIADRILSSGADVCICNTFTKKRFVDGYEQLARHHNADFEVIRMNGNFTNVHNVPADVMKNMISGFEDYPGEVIVNPE